MNGRYKNILAAMVLLLVGLSAGVARAAAAEPTVDVEIYYSKDDPNWKIAEKVIDDAAAELKSLKVTKIAIDDPSGYKKLSEAEREHKIDPTGEITMIFGPYHLTSRGTRRDVETYFKGMTTRLLKMEEKKHKGRILAKADAYAVQIFGEGSTVQRDPRPYKEDDDEIDFFRVSKDGKHVGWIADIYHFITCPICNDVQFYMAFKMPDLSVIDVRTIRELEKWGTDLPAAEVEKFTGQFKGMSPENRNRKIDALSKATKTTKAYDKITKTATEEVAKRDKNVVRQPEVSREDLERERKRAEEDAKKREKDRKKKEEEERRRKEDL